MKKALLAIVMMLVCITYIMIRGQTYTVRVTVDDPQITAEDLHFHYEPVPEKDPLVKAEVKDGYLEATFTDLAPTWSVFHQEIHHSAQTDHVQLSECAQPRSDSVSVCAVIGTADLAAQLPADDTDRINGSQFSTLSDCTHVSVRFFRRDLPDPLQCDVAEKRRTHMAQYAGYFPRDFIMFRNPCAGIDR